MGARNKQRLVGFALLLGTSVTAVTAAQNRPLLRRDADLMKQKVTAIQRRTSTESRQPARTPFTAAEVNAYLAYELPDGLPTGVVEPTVAILGPGRVAATALVDLDRVRRERNPTSLLDPFYYLSGRVPVGATGVLHTRAGTAQFELESADVGGVPVPKYVLQQIVTYYSRSAGWPDGLSLDAPFALPARIQEIQVESGQAVVVQ